MEFVQVEDEILILRSENDLLKVKNSELSKKIKHLSSFAVHDSFLRDDKIIPKHNEKMLENDRASDQEYDRSSEESDISEHIDKICNDLSSAALKENCSPADYRLTSADTEFY